MRTLRISFAEEWNPRRCRHRRRRSHSYELIISLVIYELILSFLWPGTRCVAAHIFREFHRHEHRCKAIFAFCIHLNIAIGQMVNVWIFRRLFFEFFLISAVWASIRCILVAINQMGVRLFAQLRPKLISVTDHPASTRPLAHFPHFDSPVFFLLFFRCTEGNLCIERFVAPLLCRCCWWSFCRFQVIAIHSRVCWFLRYKKNSTSRNWVDQQKETFVSFSFSFRASASLADVRRQLLQKNKNDGQMIECVMHAAKEIESVGVERCHRHRFDFLTDSNGRN